MLSPVAFANTPERKATKTKCPPTLGGDSQDQGSPTASLPASDERRGGARARPFLLPAANALSPRFAPFVRDVYHLDTSQNLKHLYAKTMTALGSGNGLAQAGTALPGAQVSVTANDGLGLLDDLLTLGQDELDVAGVRHVRVDLAMG